MYCSSAFRQTNGLNGRDPCTRLAAGIPILMQATLLFGRLLGLVPHHTPFIMWVKTLQITSTRGLTGLTVFFSLFIGSFAL